MWMFIDGSTRPDEVTIEDQGGNCSMIGTNWTIVKRGDCARDKKYVKVII